MKLHPIQNSFEAGELSTRMLGRSDSQAYQTGLSVCHNMLVDARGPVRSRAGTRFGFEYDTECSRLEAFQVDRNVYFNLIFTNLLVDITSLTGGLPAQDAVNNPFFDSGGFGWLTDTNRGGSNVSLDTGLVVLSAGNSNQAYASVLQNFTTISNSDVPHTVVVTTFGTGTYEVRIGTTQGSANVFLATTALGRFEANFVYNVAAPVALWIEVRALSQQDVLVTAIHVFDATSESITFTTVWPCEALPDLHFVSLPGGSTIYALHRSYPPYKLVYDPDTSTFSFVEVVFEDPSATPPITRPPEWTGSNWPGTGAVFQGRLWLMSTHDQPETMWGSRSGQYEAFSLVDPDSIVASDAILGVAMEHYGEISWAIGTKALVIGTVNGEYIISSSTGLLTPLDLRLERQSAYGSAPIQPNQVNDQILYVSADRRKIRAMKFVRDDNNWASKDLLFLAEHLTPSTIRDFAWAPNPDNLIWVVLGSGDLIACTYERSANIIAWHRHSTQGSFLDISAGEVAGISAINLLTSRRDGFISYEIMVNPDLSEPLDALHRQFDELNPFTVVTDLEHLEGLTVQVLANGAVLADQVVVGGQITLPREYTDVSVGLGYDKEIVTLPFDKGAQTGSGVSFMKRFNKIFARVVNSANPIINGDRPPSRSPSTPMNTAQPSLSTDIQVANLGWDRQALIHVKQDLPKHLTVIGLFGEIGQETL